MKRLIYQFEGNASSQDEDFLDDQIPLPRIGLVIRRNGRSWRVYDVRKARSTSQALSVYRIYLTLVE